MPSVISAQADNRIGLEPALLASCQHWIEQRLGLHFPPPAWPDLARHVTLLAGELGYGNPRELALEIMSRPGNPRLEQRLADVLTVSETYFFRDPACFEQLATGVLQPLICRRRAAGHRYLRLWSAGCATGEEAYSLAMTVDRLLDDAEDWHITVMGTDLNTESLAKAHAGVYGAWSFRQSVDDYRSHYFSPEPAEVVADQAGRTRFWRIRSEVAARVRFFELNLANPVYPDVGRELADVDVILCRNVLMYLSPAQALAVLGRLTQCLASDGVLLVGAVDGGCCQSAGLTTISWPGALAIPANAPTARAIEPPRGAAPRLARVVAPSGGFAEPADQQQTMAARPKSLTTATSPANAQVSDRDLHREAQKAFADGHYRNALLLAERYAKQEGLTLRQEAKGAVLCARILANLQQPDTSEYWARQAIRLDRLDPSGYWVLATILLERRRHEDALDALTKALYLQPDFALALYLSAVISKQRQQHQRARRDLRSCLAQLAPLPEGMEVFEGEGLTVADLRHLATALEADLNDGG